MENAIGPLNNVDPSANMASESGFNFFDAGLGIPINAVNNQGGGQPQDSSTWSMEDLSPMHNTAFASSSGASPGADRSAQKEALLAAVDRLIQLASLMQ